MSGKPRYRALTGLSYPTDSGIIARLQDGEQIPLDARKLKRVEAGEIVDDIPAGSVGWLLQAGVIEEVKGRRGEIRQ